MSKPRVLLADDSSRILTVVSKFLSSQFEIVGCVLNGEQAVEATLRLQPDVAVLDIHMPGLDGLQAARCLRELDSPSKIVFLTGLTDPGCIAAALNDGAHGYVLKSRLYSDLPLAIHAALEERTFCSCEPDREFQEQFVS